MTETKAAVLKEIKELTTEILGRHHIETAEQFATIFSTESELELRVDNSRVKISGSYAVDIGKRRVLSALQSGISNAGVIRFTAEDLLKQLNQVLLVSQKKWFVVKGNSISLNDQKPCEDAIYCPVEAKIFSLGARIGYLISWHDTTIFVQTTRNNQARCIFMAYKNDDGIELVRLTCEFNGESIFLENEDDTARIFYDYASLPEIIASEDSCITFGEKLNQLNNLAWINFGADFDEKLGPQSASART